MLKPGKYKNRVGAVLEVTHPVIGGVGGYLTLGGIWKAFSEPGIFGQDAYLVTEESMRESGYEPVPGEEGGNDE